MSSCHLRIQKIITARLNFTDTLGSYKAFEGKSIIKYRQEISDDLAHYLKVEFTRNIKLKESSLS